MALTKAQIKQIQDLIEKRFLGFAHEALGDVALTSDELAMLRRVGLTRSTVRSMVGDPYYLGKLVSLLERPRARTLTYDDVLEAVKRMDIPLTGTEKRAMEWSREHAGTHIRGIMDDLVKDASALNARSQATIERMSDSTASDAVRESVATSIENRETISQLKTRLYEMIDTKTSRDWQRVAHTEMNTAVQQGIYQRIREVSEDKDEQLVFKRPNPDACQHCKRVYLGSDGLTPRIFKLSDLEASNVGRKAKDWGPTVGSVHPWCNCQLFPLPDGHDFEKRKIIAEPFEKKDKKYKKGSIVSDLDYSGFSDAEKEKIGEDAILTFTGRTATPTRKSLVVNLISESGLYCDHD